MKLASSAFSRLVRALLAAAAVPILLAASDEASETGDSDDESGISVGRMIFCRGIKEREPVDPAKKFPRDIEQVFCFTVILNAGPETHVVHKWYHGDQLVAEVTLKAKGEYWRTWSTKHMVPGWTGTWRVDIVSADGKVLKSASFALGQADSGESGDAEGQADGQESAEED